MGRVETILVAVPSIPIHDARHNGFCAQHLRGWKVHAVREMGSIEFGHQRLEFLEAIIGHGPSIGPPFGLPPAIRVLPERTARPYFTLAPSGLAGDEGLPRTEGRYRVLLVASTSKTMDQPPGSAAFTYRYLGCTYRPNSSF